MTPISETKPSESGGNADLVLIVDDVPDNLAVLHDALDESGYTVLVATNGEANDAVVVIISMDMDPIEVKTRILSNLADLDWSVLMRGSPGGVGLNEQDYQKLETGWQILDGEAGRLYRRAVQGEAEAVSVQVVPGLGAEI